MRRPTCGKHIEQRGVVTAGEDVRVFVAVAAGAAVAGGGIRALRLHGNVRGT